MKDIKSPCIFIPTPRILNMRSSHIITFLSFVVIGFYLVSCDDDIPSVNVVESIYFQQAVRDNGVNNYFHIPDGFIDNDSIRKSDGRIILMMGIIRSGGMGAESFTVDLEEDESESRRVVESGDIENAVFLSKENYSISSQVTVPQGSYETDFFLSLDTALLFNDITFKGKKAIITLALQNPTKYSLSENFSKITLVIDVDDLKEQYWNPADGFLYREGSKLFLNREEYRGVGINATILNGCGAANELFSEKDVHSLFSDLPDNALVRIHAFKNNMETTDMIVKAAEEHNIKLMLSLLEGQNRGCGAYWVGAGWFRNRVNHEDFIEYAKSMALKYKDSPGVGIWEIVDRPNISEDLVKQFLHEIAREIKLIDPNHLVASGVEGEWVIGESQVSEPYQNVHTSKFIDIGTMSDIDALQIESYHLRACKDAMDNLDKPFIIISTNLKGSDSLNCDFDKNARVKRFQEKVNYYIGQKTSIVFTPDFVKQDIDECNTKFDSEDPLFQTAIDYMNDFLH